METICCIVWFLWNCICLLYMMITLCTFVWFKSNMRHFIRKLVANKMPTSLYPSHRRLRPYWQNGDRYFLRPTEKVGCFKFGCYILTSNLFKPILCMAAIWYIGPMRLVPTYLQCAAIRSMSAKFHQDTIYLKLRDWFTLQKRGGQTDGLTDGQTNERTDGWTDIRTESRANGQLRLAWLLCWSSYRVFLVKDVYYLV